MIRDFFQSSRQQLNDIKKGTLRNTQRFSNLIFEFFKCLHTGPMKNSVENRRVFFRRLINVVKLKINDRDQRLHMKCVNMQVSATTDEIDIKRFKLCEKFLNCDTQKIYSDGFISLLTGSYSSWLMHLTL